MPSPEYEFLTPAEQLRRLRLRRKQIRTAIEALEKLERLPVASTPPTDRFTCRGLGWMEPRRLA